MTMHMLKGFSSNITKKHKPDKFTKSQMKMFELELLDYNRVCKRDGRHKEKMTLEQFIDYKHGIINEPSVKKQTTVYKPEKTETNRKISNRDIKSLNPHDLGVCVLAKKKEYTGTCIVGIATMHKSNAVPVFNLEQAEEIAKMRR